MNAINITAYTEDASQIEAIKAVIKAFKIKYSISKAKEAEKHYDAKFTAKIKKSQQDYKKGKGRKVSIEELNALWK